MAADVPVAGAVYKEFGGASVIHGARGRASNRQMNPGVRQYAVELVKTKYADFGPTLAAEVLLDKHSIKVGRETLRRWMVAEGLWLSRKQRRSFHQPRLRRESYGELIQIDGSEHRWFEQRGEPCTLLVFIDDATSQLMQLRFAPRTRPAFRLTRPRDARKVGSGNFIRDVTSGGGGGDPPAMNGSVGSPS